jgi:hypothetical protein
MISLHRYFVATSLAVSLAVSASAQTVAPTDIQLRVLYDQVTRTSGPYRYKMSHILVATEQEAASLIVQLSAGSLFERLAQRASLDTRTRLRGGSLGWRGAFDVDEGLWAAMRPGRIGLYPYPLKTSAGWHVVTIDEILPEPAPSFEASRAALARVLRARQVLSPRESDSLARSWTIKQVEAVLRTAYHSAGGDAIEFETLDFDSLAAAERYIAGRSDRSASRSVQRYSVENLIEVEPPLRRYLGGQTRGLSITPIERTLSGGRRVWTLLDVIKRRPRAEFEAGPALVLQLAAWVRAGLLPSPEAILGTPEEEARAQYFFATDAAAASRINPSLPPDIEFGDGSTPLLHAIYLDNLELAKALELRGASANFCGATDCPLNLVLMRLAPERAAVWMDWLLSVGATVNTRPAFGAGIAESPLNAAAWKGNLEAVKRLVALGASVQGTTGSRFGPLATAAANAQREVAQWLIAQGADPLSPMPSGSSSIALTSAARLSGNADFVAWADQQVLARVESDPTSRFTVQIQQAGRVHTVVPGMALRLRAVPFNMIFRHPAGLKRLMIGGSLSPGWTQAVRAMDTRLAVYRTRRLSEAASAGPYIGIPVLPLSGVCAPDAAPTEACPGTYYTLGLVPTQAASPRTDPKSASLGSVSWSHPVDALAEFSPTDFNVPETRIPIQALAGKSVQVLVALPVHLGGESGMRLVRPLLFTIEFHP